VDGVTEEGTMNPEIIRMIMNERARERRDVAAAWRAGRALRLRRLPRTQRPRIAWKTRAA
jgi:hypothetical protein